MATYPKALIRHYHLMQRLNLTALLTARRQWAKINPDTIAESWEQAAAPLQEVVSVLQIKAAKAGAKSINATLLEQGIRAAAMGAIDPAGFATISQTLLQQPAVKVLTAIKAGHTVARALELGRHSLDRIITSQIIGAGSDAAQIEIAVRPTIYYVRMVAAGACDRCMILAGRIYRWNDGFERHPHCHCKHFPTEVADRAEAIANGFIDDPREAFNKLTREQQDKTFGMANAEAIRNGADLSQVVNSKRGATKNGNFTLEGTSRRGYAGSLLKPGQRRMTPQLILEQAGNDRTKYLQLLREHGYLLPEGVTPKGRDYLGYGQMGHGRAGSAAAKAIAEAERTGVRDPMNRYTMTAAERRAYDAAYRAQATLEGRNPYRSPEFSQTPDPYGHSTVGGYGAGARSLPAPTLVDMPNGPAEMLKAAQQIIDQNLTQPTNH